MKNVAVTLNLEGRSVDVTLPGSMRLIDLQDALHSWGPWVRISATGGAHAGVDPRAMTAAEVARDLFLDAVERMGTPDDVVEAAAERMHRALDTGASPEMAAAQAAIYAATAHREVAHA